MSVQPTRFKSLDEEFNTVVSTVKKSDPAEIVNSASNSVSTGVSGIVSSVSRFTQSLNINNIFSKINNAKNSLENATGIVKFLKTGLQVQDAIRRVRGLLENSILTNKNGLNNLDGLIEGLFKNDPISQNLLKLINGRKGNRPSSKVPSIKPYPTIIKSPTGAIAKPGYVSTDQRGDPKEDHDTIAQLLDSSTGSNYKDYTVVDKNAILIKAVTLGNLGYDANLPNVLKSIKNLPGMTDDVYERAVTFILTEQTSKGNAAAVLDITTGVDSPIANTSSVIHSTPAIISDLFANFVKPSEVKAVSTGEFIDGVFGSAQALDPNWNVSKTDGILSIRNLLSSSEQLTESLKLRASSNQLSENTLENYFDSDNDVLLAAMLGLDPSVKSHLDGIANSKICKAKECPC